MKKLDSETFQKVNRSEIIELSTIYKTMKQEPQLKIGKAKSKEAKQIINIELISIKWQCLGI